MEKEILVLKKIEQRFVQRQKIAHNTSKYLFEHSRKETLAEVGKLNRQLDRDRDALFEKALAEANEEGLKIKQREEDKQQKLHEAFQEKHESIKQILVKEVFDYGNR